MKIIKDIGYGDDRLQSLDLYLPSSDEFDVFVYFHGGGIEAGDKNENGHIAKYITERGIALVSANYRMFPSAKYPDFLDDAAHCVRWTLDNISSFGKCKGIYVGGSSAGGYLSMMLCFDSEFYAKYGIDPMSISGYIHDAGQPTCHANVLRSKGIDARRVVVDEASPLFYVGIEKDYPRMSFIISDNDIYSRYEQTVLMISTLKHFGYGEDKVRLRLMHGDHCAYVARLDEKGDSVFGKMVCDFINQE